LIGAARKVGFLRPFVNVLAAGVMFFSHFSTYLNGQQRTYLERGKGGTWEDNLVPKFDEKI